MWCKRIYYKLNNSIEGSFLRSKKPSEKIKPSKNLVNPVGSNRTSKSNLCVITQQFLLKPCKYFTLSKRKCQRVQILMCFKRRLQSWWHSKE